MLKVNFDLNSYQLYPKTKDALRIFQKKNANWNLEKEREEELGKLKESETKLPCLAQYNGKKENQTILGARGTVLAYRSCKNKITTRRNQFALASRFFEETEPKCDWSSEPFSGS